MASCGSCRSGLAVVSVIFGLFAGGLASLGMHRFPMLNLSSQTQYDVQTTQLE